MYSYKKYTAKYRQLQKFTDFIIEEVPSLQNNHSIVLSILMTLNDMGLLAPMNQEEELTAFTITEDKDEPLC